MGFSALVAIASLPMAMLAGGLAVGAHYPYETSGWISPEGSRPAPPYAARYGACPTEVSEAGDACRAKEWSELLTRYKEEPLAAPPGGKAYRFITTGVGNVSPSNIYRAVSRPTLYRLDIAASGKGALRAVSLRVGENRSVRDRFAQSTKSLTLAQVRAFESAFADSDFATDPIKSDGFSNCFDAIGIVAEAITPMGYRWTVDPCSQIRLWGAINLLERDAAKVKDR